MDARDRAEIEKCVHHWIIDSHNFGVCKLCGERKQFEHSCLDMGHLLPSWKMRIASKAVPKGQRQGGIRGYRGEPNQRREDKHRSYLE